MTAAIGIIVAHGKLAKTLLSTAELIVGRLEDCFAISGLDLCDEEVVERIREIIMMRDNRKVVLFVDYFGGSCCSNCVRATDGIIGVRVISGVNLPMILDFVTKRETMAFEEMIDHLIERGRQSVRIIDL
jgi:mannose/fructose-specific phosphotransferase system component IIA